MQFTCQQTDSAKAKETSAPVREMLDKMIARRLMFKAAQKTQSALDLQHDLYVLFTAPTGQGDKLELTISSRCEQT